VIRIVPGSSKIKDSHGIARTAQGSLDEKHYSLKQYYISRRYDT
jgi:hypothetical protein